MSYIGVGPSNQVFNVPQRPKDGMGITFSVTGNEGLDKMLFWGFVLGASYLALSFGYEGITGHKLLPSGRTLAAWELGG